MAARNPSSTTWAEWVVKEVREHQLRSVGSLWAAGVGGSLLYNWTRPIPTSLKIIHSRMYAQALTITALVAAAGVELYGARYIPQPAEDHRNEYQPHKRVDTAAGVPSRH